MLYEVITSPMKTPGPQRGQYRRDGVAVFPLTVKYAERLTEVFSFLPFAAILQPP